MTFVQSAWYGRMKLMPVRQLPSGAKRASGMLISPVCPVTLGSAARTDAGSTARKSEATKRERPRMGAFS